MKNTEVVSPKAATVMVFGTYHFQNPSLDLVKNRTHNVMDKDSQTYLNELSDRITKFRPTVVLLEFDPKDESQINLKYQEYLKGKKELAVDEIEQLGFRIAKKCQLQRVNSFDNRKTPWKSEELFKQIKKYPKLENEFNKAVQSLAEYEDQLHKSKSLRDIFIHYNSQEMDQKNKSLYILTNEVGAGTDFSGANAASSWWHRNFKMFSIIQKFAQHGERVLVIGGQGHIAVIRNLMELDPKIISEDINQYL